MKKIIKYVMGFSFVFLLFPLSVFAHGPGEKVSVPCSARLEVGKNYDDTKWQAYMFPTIALTDSLLKSHNVFNEADGDYALPMEVEITTKDGEKIPMIAGYHYTSSGGNLLMSYQMSGDTKYLFSGLSDEAEKDEKMRQYGEFLNITCAFRSQ